MIKLTPSEGGTAFKIAPGVWAKKVTISSVEDWSNYPTRPDLEIKQVGEKKTQPELCIEIKFTDGQYEKAKKLWRKWEKDRNTKEPIGWATFMNPILFFFVSAIGEKQIEVNDDWTIPQKMLNACIGKEIIIVQYQTNKWNESKTSDWAGYTKDYWTVTFPPDTEKNVIQKLWEDNIKFVTDYGRDIALAEEEKKEEQKTSNDIEEQKPFTTDDDDLPF